MSSRPDFRLRSNWAIVICIVAIAGLSGCGGAGESSGDCAFVSQEHLAVPRDGRSGTLICNPQRVSAPYRDRYFPASASGAGTP